jgi:hypothetical protein
MIDVVRDPHVTQKLNQVLDPYWLITKQGKSKKKP